MNATIIDGKATAASVRAETAENVQSFAAKIGRPPSLAVVLVGEDPASQVYVRNKVRQAGEVGVASREERLPADIDQNALIERVTRLSADPDVDGILVQLPLPAPLEEAPVIAAIAPEKDVDGLTERSAGRLLLGKPGLRPCTPTGCVILAEQTLGALAGKSCVVLGRSILVGKPAALLFLEKNCTVTIAHSRTENLDALCRTADVLVAAVGRPGMVRGEWVKPGACVIDVGINRVPAPEKGDGATRLVGDVTFDEAIEVAGAITPVPGGVGPMTVACLLSNTLLAARARAGLD